MPAWAELEQKEQGQISPIPSQPKTQTPKKKLQQKYLEEQIQYCLDVTEKQN